MHSPSSEESVGVLCDVARQPNTNRLLISIVGFLFSVIGVLGNHQVSQIEASNKETKTDVKNLKEALRILHDEQTKITARVESLEQFRTYFTGLQDGENKRLGEIEGSVRVLTSEYQGVSRDLSRLEGKLDRQQERGH